MQRGSDDTLEKASRLMEAKKIRRLPVIDANKRMVGMLSIGDMSHFADEDVTGELMQAVSGHHA